MHYNDVCSLTPNDAIYYRGLKSRKPYKVKFISIDRILHDDVCLVNVEFSSLKVSKVKSKFLFFTWEDAENIAPIRNKQSPNPKRQIKVYKAQNILLSSGAKVPGIEIRLGSLEAIITSSEADVLLRRLVVALGYTGLLGTIQCNNCNNFISLNSAECLHCGQPFM